MMEILYLIMFFIVGLVFGSFYTVVGLRVPVNASIVRPGSHCERCGHHLKWYELIPILSYIFLGGKCRNCHEKISIIYPFIELSTGILFAVSYYSYGFAWDLGISLILCSLLILVIVSDLNYMIIPDSFIVIPSIMIIIIKIFTLGFYDTLISIGYGVISFIMMYLVMLLGKLLFKKDCLGGADIKLMFLAGLVLNPLRSILVVFLASVIALPISMFLYFKNKERMIPFGPFIMIGLLIIYFSKIQPQNIINFLLNL